MANGKAKRASIARPSWKTKTSFFRNPINWAKVRYKRWASQRVAGAQRLHTPQTHRAKAQLRKR